MRYYYFAESIEPALLNKLPQVLKELGEGESMETLVNRYHVGSAVSKSRASKVFLGDPHFIEILGFLTYLHDSEGYSFEELSKKVVFVTKSHAFIFASGAIYHADPDSKKFSQIYPISNNEGICFISARESFYHPFFLLVE